MNSSIHDLIVTPLRIIGDERGSVMHMLRRDDPHFRAFGEIYFSTVRCGVVKGWKRHLEMTLNLAVPSGRVRLVVFDDRADSLSRGAVDEVLLGTPDCYRLVTIPPKLWFGFQGVARDCSIVANCATMPHRADEAEVQDISDSRIPYTWPVADPVA